MHPLVSHAAHRRQTFAEAFDPKNNAFGFLRLVLAVLVIFSHSYCLGAFGIDGLEALTQRRHTIGLAAVAMFFVLSGFLICRSASGVTSIPRFLWHRFLRIFPGYWVCLIVSACVFAPLLALEERGSPFGVFAATHNSPLDYITGNALLFHFKEFTLEGLLNIRPQLIAGLLSRNPYPYMINGSLWTLPFEVGCYLVVAALAVFGMLRRARSVLFALFLSLGCLYVFCDLNPQAFRAFFSSRALPSVVTFSFFFFAGGVCFLYRDKIPNSPGLFLASVLLLAASVPLGRFGLVAPFAMTYALLWLAFRLPLQRFDANGDFSYGTYIYAFPVQQGLALVGLHREGFAVYFLSSLLLTFLLAIASYHLVEAPCLRLKHLQLPPWRWRKSQPGRAFEVKPLSP